MTKALKRNTAVTMSKRKTPSDGKNPAAVELGRKGGQISAARLTKEERVERARKASRTYWSAKRKAKR